jgi:hypothetical protein
MKRVYEDVDALVFGGASERWDGMSLCVYKPTTPRKSSLLYHTCTTSFSKWVCGRVHGACAFLLCRNNQF